MLIKNTKRLVKEMKFNVINVIIVVKKPIKEDLKKLENSLFKEYVYHDKLYKI